MGKEINTSPLRIKNFLGLNKRVTDTAIDIREAAGLENVIITEESLEQRGGSTVLNTVGNFKDKTDASDKVITGAYQGILNGTNYQVAVGGDAFKQLSAGAWTDRTGAITITDNVDNHWTFATTIDSAVAEVIVGANGVDAPFKWTGAGNATALSSTPGNFNYPVVHKNKLWVAVGDIVYFSGLRNCESWAVSTDLVRFDNKGEDITGLVKFGDMIVVFQKTAIHAISGSSNRDLFTQTIVTGEGCVCGLSIQEIESRRYGNILAFLSNDGTIKGFNGSKNLIKLSDYIKPLFDEMNSARWAQCVSGLLKTKGQYWLAMTYGSGTQNDQVIIYDYRNDYHTGADGRPLSSCLYHTGIKANAMTAFTSSNSEYLVTANYNYDLLRQDYGLLDEDATAIRSTWLSGKIDFGAPQNIKLLSDFSLITTQSGATNMSIVCTSQDYSGISTLALPASGGLWGTMIWGTGLWSAPSTTYTRARFTLTDSSLEGSISGRHLQFQINHSDISEAMAVEEIVIGVTDLGYQPEYIET